MEEVTIHQTLHGYSDGHSLLASSTDLSSEEKFVLLKMSDLSGSLSGSEFEPYITAYPLSGQFYAVAKTWPANEMRRPGCVWTHTILIGSATLGRIENLGQLNKLLQKPSKDSVQHYQKTITITQTRRTEVITGTKEFLNLCALLYSSNKSHILVSPPKNIEQLLFEVWSYQWPRLRRSFSFSIGSFSPRYFSNRPLDIQVMNSRDYHPGATNKNDLVLNHSLISLPSDANWTELIKESDMNEVLSFMYKYGSDVEPVRTKYFELLLAYQLNKEVENLENPINTLFSFFKTHFKDRAEAKNLKRDLILKAFENDKRNLYYFLIFANQNEGNLEPFSEINWNYSAIIEELWVNKIISLIELQSLLIQIKINDISAGFFMKFPLESWIASQYVSGPFVREIVQTDPLLIANDLVWTQEKAIQKYFFEAYFESGKATTNILSSVIHSMISNNNDLFAKELVAIYRTDAVVTALNASELTNKPLPSEWERQSLSFIEPIVNHATEGQLSSYKINLVLKIADKLPQLYDTTKVINLIEKANTVQNPMVVRLNCIIISAALKNQMKESARIFSRVFQRVHDHAKTGNLSATDWEIIYLSFPKDRRIIPKKSKSWFGDDDDEVPFWDRCEFLRRALLECFVQFNWTIDYFFESIKDSETLKRVAKFAAKSDIGNHLMVQLIQPTMSRKYPDHTKIIFKFIDKRR